MKPPELTVGWPTNSRLAKDLEPLRGALRLEAAEPGVLRTPDFPQARFRELRAQDIANILEQQRYRSAMSLGITGADIITERSLQESSLSSGIYTRAPQSPCVLEIGTTPSELRVLVRNEDIEDGTYLQQRRGTESGSKRIVSSYPFIAERAVVYPFMYGMQGRLGDDMRFFRCNLGQVLKVDGKVESFLRNQDFPDTLAAVDVVRTGKTAEEFGLKPIGRPILTSYPGLYRRPRNPNSEDSAMIEDFITFFRSALAAANIPELPARPMIDSENAMLQPFRFPRNPQPSFDPADERGVGEYF